MRSGSDICAQVGNKGWAGGNRIAQVERGFYATPTTPPDRAREEQMCKLTQLGSDAYLDVNDLLREVYLPVRVTDRERVCP